MTAAKKRTTPSLAERGQNMDLWPTSAGPWVPWSDDMQIYDDGYPWCNYVGCHPNGPGQRHYPHPDHPATECRTRAGVQLDDVRAELDGGELYLDVYAAHSFAFGEQRLPRTQRTRIVFAFAPDNDDLPDQRFSMPLGDALVLARHLQHLVDVVSYYVPDHCGTA